MVLDNNIPSKFYPKRSKASSCRDLLQQLRSLTYLVYDSDALDDLEERLNVMLNDLSEAVPNDGGINVEEVKYHKPTKEVYKEKLPQPHLKKSKLTGKVGVGAERMRYHQNISLPSDRKQKIIEVEVVPHGNYMLYNDHGDLINDYTR